MIYWKRVQFRKFNATKQNRYSTKETKCLFLDSQINAASISSLIGSEKEASTRDFLTAKVMFSDDLVGDNVQDDVEDIKIQCQARSGQKQPYKICISSLETLLLQQGLWLLF